MLRTLKRLGSRQGTRQEGDNTQQQQAELAHRVLSILRGRGRSLTTKRMISFDLRWTPNRFEKRQNFDVNKLRTPHPRTHLALAVTTFLSCSALQVN
jgi:hypothetical protein